MRSPSAQTRAFAPVPALGLAIAATLSGFTAAIISALATGVHLHHLVPWQVNVVQFSFYVGIGAVLLPGLPRVAGRSLPELGLAVPQGRQLLWGVLGLPVMLVATSIIGLIVTAVAGQHEQAALRMLPRFNTPGLLLSFAFVASVAAPFFEELFFRGLIFNALRARLSFWPSALVSALIFAGAHGDPWAFFPLCGVGICLAYIYWRSGSLWASMVAHGLFNAFSLVAVSMKDHLRL